MLCFCVDSVVLPDVCTHCGNISVFATEFLKSWCVFVHPGAAWWLCGSSYSSVRRPGVSVCWSVGGWWWRNSCTVGQCPRVNLFLYINITTLQHHSFKYNWLWLHFQNWLDTFVGYGVFSIFTYLSCWICWHPGFMMFMFCVEWLL